MKKVHRAVQTGPNKWEKRTGWEWDAEDVISLVVLLMIAGYVALRTIVG